MNVFIVGQKWFGAEVLRVILGAGCAVPAVCAPMLAPDGRYDRLYAAAMARAGMIVVASYRPASLRAHMVPEGTDLIVSAHSRVIIGPDIRARARLGAIGYHPSLLPRHRGPDAVAWTIAMRDPIAGGTIYLLDEIVDGGRIVVQEACHVPAGDTAAALWRRSLAPLGLALLARVLADPDAMIAAARPQDESAATVEPRLMRSAPRFKEALDAVDFGQSAG